MRSAWAAAALVGGLVACGFYDAVPSPSSPFGPDIGLPDAGLPNLPDGSYALPDGGFQLPDGGFQLPDGGFQLPDGGFQLPDGGFEPGHGCPGPACVPQVLASGESGPQELALGGGFLYWVDMSARTLRRMGKSGTSVETFSELRGVRVAVADDEAAYALDTWSAESDAPVRLGHDGMSAQMLATWQTSPRELHGLVHNRTSLFIERWGVGLTQIDKRGGGAQVRLTGEGRGRPAADPDGLYFTDVDRGRVMYLGAQGAPVSVGDLPPGTSVTAAHADVSDVYVALQPMGVEAGACTGGTLAQGSRLRTGLVFTSATSGCVRVLTGDAHHLYWIARLPERGHYVLRASRAGGAAGVIAPVQGSAWGLVVDDTHVYWSEQDMGRILRIPKPPPGTKLDPPPN